MSDKILDISPFACVLVTDDLKINYMNQAMSQFLSVDQDQDLEGKTILAFIPADHQDSFCAYINQLGKPIREQVWKSFPFVDAGGQTKTILINGTHSLDEFGEPDVSVIVGMPLFDSVLDEILPEYAQQSLVDKLVYNKFENIFHSAPVGITLLDESDVVEETNETFASFLEKPRGEVVGASFVALFDGFVNKNLGDSLSTIRQNKKSIMKMPLTINLHDDTSRLIEVRISQIGKTYEQTDKIMVISEDITDQEETHATLMQNEKLALTGRLAASLAHEINNPLQTSIGCLGLAQEILGEDRADLRVYLEMATEELKRSARIVKKLRDLNRKTDIRDRTPVDLQQTLEGVLTLTKNRFFDQKIVPVFLYQGIPPVVMASRDQLQQVFLNLVMNALDAQPDGGQVFIDIIPTLEPAGFTVKIRDSGSGLDPSTRDHLFDPFFSTKDDGLGLGLYISRTIIDDHEGTIDVESEMGEGTEFSIWLPGMNMEGEE